MIIVLLRTFLIYVIALFVIRVMGKGELSKMDPFQLVILIMIAELAAMPIESTDVSVFTGIAAMFSLLFLQVLFSQISMKSAAFSRLISGRPCIVVDKGVINEKELRRLRISISDLTEQLRLKNFPSLTEVEYAILEANGDLSVIARAGKKPLTPEDSGIEKETEDLPVTLIADGSLSEAGLRLAGLSEEELLAQLRLSGETNYKKVLYCFRDQQGVIHTYLRGATAGDPGEAAAKKEAL